MDNQFGPYRLLRRIGLGDFAEVYVATRDAEPAPTELGAMVGTGGGSAGPAHAGAGLYALKRISREMRHRPEVRALFAQEMKLAVLFDHPHVARVHDAGEIGGRQYLAMEYIPGSDLRALCERLAPARMPPGVVLRVGLDICAALGYLHEACDGAGQPLGLVHGDITPSNIVCSTEGAAKLIDFSASFSRLRPDEAVVRGTYAYMSPEQVRGGALDQRSDVFSLGVVLWELLAGRRLFRRAASYLTLAAVVEEPAPKLADVAGLQLGTATAGVDAVLARALGKDADERYADAGELAAELAELAVEHGWDSRAWGLRGLVRDS